MADRAAMVALLFMVIVTFPCFFSAVTGGSSGRQSGEVRRRTVAKASGPFCFGVRVRRGVERASPPAQRWIRLATISCMTYYGTPTRSPEQFPRRA